MVSFFSKKHKNIKKLKIFKIVQNILFWSKNTKNHFFSTKISPFNKNFNFCNIEIHNTRQCPYSHFFMLISTLTIFFSTNQ